LKAPRISGETANILKLRADGFVAQNFLAEMSSSADALAAVREAWEGMGSDLQLPGVSQ
jgi:hypothetical protein